LGAIAALDFEGKGVSQSETSTLTDPVCSPCVTQSITKNREFVDKMDYFLSKRVTCYPVGENFNLIRVNKRVCRMDDLAKNQYSLC
jgi:hypothetical protein